MASTTKPPSRKRAPNASTKKNIIAKKGREVVRSTNFTNL